MTEQTVFKYDIKSKSILKVFIASRYNEMPKLSRHHLRVLGYPNNDDQNWQVNQTIQGTKEIINYVAPNYGQQALTRRTSKMRRNKPGTQDQNKRTEETGE